MSRISPFCCYGRVWHKPNRTIFSSPVDSCSACSALSGRREGTDRNVISVRISERMLSDGPRIYSLFGVRIDGDSRGSAVPEAG